MLFTNNKTDLIVKMIQYVIHISYKCSTFQHYKSGFPRSGKSQWKMKKIQGQGKVREFCVESGKFEILEKVREKSGNFITTCHSFECWLLLFWSRSMYLNSRDVQTFTQLWYRILDWYIVLMLFWVWKWKQNPQNCIIVSTPLMAGLEIS